MANISFREIQFGTSSVEPFMQQSLEKLGVLNVMAGRAQ